MRDPFRNIVGPRILIVSNHHHHFKVCMLNNRYSRLKAPSCVQDTRVVQKQNVLVCGGNTLFCAQRSYVERYPCFASSHRDFQQRGRGTWLHLRQDIWEFVVPHSAKNSTEFASLRLSRSSLFARAEHRGGALYLGSSLLGGFKRSSGVDSSSVSGNPTKFATCTAELFRHTSVLRVS